MDEVARLRQFRPSPAPADVRNDAARMLRAAIAREIETTGAGCVSASRAWLGGRIHLRQRRRTLLAIFAAAVIVVPPAVAFRGDLLSLIEGTPAPRSVVTTFERINLGYLRLRKLIIRDHLKPSFYARIEVSKLRGVVELETPEGTVSLWEAPQTSGGECWVWNFDLRTAHRPVTQEECDQPAMMGMPITSTSWLRAARLPNLVIVDARLNAARAEVEFSGGATYPMEIVAGYAVAAVSTDEQPLRIIAENARGQTLSTWYFLSTGGIGGASGTQLFRTPATERIYGSAPAIVIKSPAGAAVSFCSDALFCSGNGVAQAAYRFLTNPP